MQIQILHFSQKAKTTVTLAEEEALILSNLGLVFKHVKKFKTNCLSDVDDLFQAGCLGLLKAIRRHDPSRGKLSTIAWITILQEIIKEQRKNKTESRNTKVIDNDNIAKFLVDRQDYFAKSAQKFTEYLPELSDEEYNIIGYRVMGMSFNEIAQSMNYPIRHIKLVYKKIKTKIIRADKRNESKT